jgi:ABC-type multidrug transport system ATPase subunit
MRTHICAGRAEDTEKQKGGFEGMKISVTPVTLEWRDIGFRTRYRGKWKEILRGCTGQAIPGHMTALMGPSGMPTTIT